jgi:hypothetical protein
MMKSDAIRRSSRWGLALMVALAVVHPGCGGNNTSGSDDTITDTQTMGVLGFFPLPFTAQRNGTVNANVNWNSSGNDVDIYATLGTCANLDVLINGGCNVIAFSESATAKPETLTFSVSNGNLYSLVAVNLGPGSDTVTIRLTAH